MGVRHSEYVMDVTLEEALDVLRQARGLLVRSGWVQGKMASDGIWEVPYYSPKATCYCASGAVFRVAPGEVAYAALTLLERGASTGAIVPWNDELGRTKAEVIQAFDLAILHYTQ